MWLKKRWRPVVVGAFVVVWAMQAAQIRPSVTRGQSGNGSSDTPYIYYYSDGLNAWVIERADGTDTHILGEGLVQKAPEAYSVAVDGPGWSPSGKWLAFSAQSVFSYPFRGIDDNKPYIISSDGSSQLPCIGQLQHAQMAWSPHEDLLLVAANFVKDRLVSTPQEAYPAELQTSFMVIDANQQAILASVEEITKLQGDGDRLRLEGPVAVKWIADGKYGMVVLNRGYGDTAMTIVTLFDRLGGVSQKEFAQVLSDWPRFINRGYPISNHGDIVYATNDGFIVENLISGIQHKFDIHLIHPELIWNDTGQYALIRGERDYLLTVNDEEAKLDEISRGDLSFILEPGLSEVPALWSPEGHLFPFQAIGGSVYLLDAEKGELTLIQPPFKRAFDWTWVNSHTALLDGPQIGNDHPPHQLFAIFDFLENPYQAQEIRLENIELGTKPSLSPDGQHIAHMQDGAVIQDLASGSVIKVRPAAASYLSDYGEKVEWSADGNWLLLFDNALVAGAAGDSAAQLGIVRFDGTMRRDLTYSPTLTQISLNWLPTEVDVNVLPVAVPDFTIDPALLLVGNDWSFLLEWSPDGQQLASGLGVYDFGDIWIWQLSTGYGELQFTDVDWLEEVEWQVSANGEYIPSLAENEVRTDGRFRLPLALSVNQKWVVASNEARQMVVIDVEDSNELVVIGEIGSVTSASFSPSSDLLAVGYLSSPAVIYDTRTWEIIGQLPYTGTGVAFSPDSQYLAVGVSWDVEIWRVSDLIGEHE